MGGSEAQLQAATAEPAMAAMTGAGLLAVGAVALAAGATVAAALSLASPAPLLSTLLTLLAGLGLFFVLATAAGHIHLGGRVADADLVRAVADGLAEGVLVTGGDGAVLYMNSRIEMLTRAAELGAAGALERLVGGNAEGEAALFRMNRAAARREAAEADITTTDLDGVGRTLRVTVRPFTLAGQERDVALGRLSLWTVADVTTDRVRESKAREALEARLTRFQVAPVGLFAVAPDGTVPFVNATLAGWLGPRGDGLARLSDLVPADSAALINGLAATAAREPVPVMLDLLREDGRLLPVRAVVSGAADTAQPQLSVAVWPELAGGGLPGGMDAAEHRFQRFFQAAPFGIATVGADGRIGDPNGAFARLILDPKGGVGETALTVLGRDADEETRIALDAGLKHVLSGRGNLAPVEVTVGRERTHACRVYMHPLAGGTSAGGAAVLYVVDATEHKALEAKFAQSSKMEAVGKLAGGIAHDFNNMLTAILGFTDMLLATHRPTDVAYKDLRNIKSSAERAAGLVGKLLAFSRQQTLLKETLQLGEVLTDLAPLLKRSIGEKIELKMTTGRDLWPVKTDKIQLEQAVINLAVNARDAMPSGGTLTIRSRNVAEREVQKLVDSGMTIGEYVLIEVEDTGTGMPPEVLAKIFEPFFTTKGVGKGTGLGLATVYGIIKQTGGYIFADSTPGKGTTFRVYLPRHHVEPEETAREEKALAAQKIQKAADLTGSGRVLLVEDEDVVRSFAVRALKSRGYEVLEAGSGVEALEVMETVGGEVDIVVSDVVMPEMDGPTLLKELRSKNRDIKIIFVSGYPNEAFKQQLDENEDFAFLPKPFTLPQLAAKVKEVLGR